MGKESTPEQRARRAAYLRRYREQQMEGPGRQAFLEQRARHQRDYSQRHPERVREIEECWRLRNIDKVRENRRLRERANRERNPIKQSIKLRRYKLRRWGISKTAERALIDRVYAIIPSTLPRDVRDDVIGMVFEGVYSGRFPRRVQPDHARQIIAEHYRQFSKFDTVSLDAVVHEGATRGQLMGVY